jgi:hypothetical protein
LIYRSILLLKLKLVLRFFLCKSRGKGIDIPRR